MIAFILLFPIVAETGFVKLVKLILNVLMIALIVMIIMAALMIPMIIMSKNVLTHQFLMLFAVVMVFVNLEKLTQAVQGIAKTVKMRINAQRISMSIMNRSASMSSLSPAAAMAYAMMVQKTTQVVLPTAQIVTMITGSLETASTTKHRSASILNTTTLKISTIVLVGFPILRKYLIPDGLLYLQKIKQIAC